MEKKKKYERTFNIDLLEVYNSDGWFKISLFDIYSSKEHKTLKNTSVYSLRRALFKLVIYKLDDIDRIKYKVTIPSILWIVEWNIIKKIRRRINGR